MTLVNQQNPHSSNNLQQQHSSRYRTPIEIPKSLIDSHKSIVGLIPLQKNKEQSGLHCFWPIILSYLQIQHYNIQFSKIFATQKPLQPQNDQKQQQRSEDALSIGSSINIRQRKVSFGIINYRNEQSNKKKIKKPQSIWMIINQTDQNKLNQLQQTQILVNNLIKKIKLLVYEYAHKKDQACPNSKPINSIQAAKAFTLLFPQQEKQLLDIFLYQKNNINSILQFIASPKVPQSQKTNPLSRSMRIIFEALDKITPDKILVFHDNQANLNQNQSNETKVVSNIKALMEYFGFKQGTDFRRIKSSHENNTQSRNSLNPTNGQTNIKELKTNQLQGIQFKNGFFRVFFTQSGYLTSINIQSLQNVIQNIKKIFSKPFNQQNTKQHIPENKITQTQNPQGSVLTWQQTHFHKVTPSGFISRYNNRYFKNQRLIYKQKSKLQSRFKEQQLEDLIPRENYECGYQIFINSRGQNLQNEERNKDNFLETNFSQLRLNVLENTYIIQPTLDNSFLQRKQPELQQNYFNQSENCFTQNSRPFYAQEEDTFQFQTRDSKEDYDKKRLTRQQQIENLYKREDFEISDNEILDDIERVLI